MLECGLVQEGLRHLDYAFELDPSLYRVLTDRARVLAMLGRYTEAYQTLDDPRLYNRGFSTLLNIRARIIQWQRNSAEAQKLLKHPEIVRGDHPRAALLLRTVLGEVRPQPTELYGNFGSMQGSPRGRAFLCQMQAELYCLLGQVDEALQAVARGIDAGLFDVVWLDRCAILEPMRRDPRLFGLRRIVAERALAAQRALQNETVPKAG
jgi:serine/threonine-protein kinase